MTRPVLLYSGALFIVTALSLNLPEGIFQLLVRMTMIIFAFAWLLDRFPTYRVRALPGALVLLTVFVLLNYTSLFWAINQTEAILYSFRFLLCLVASFLVYDTYRELQELKVSMQAYIVGMYVIFAQVVLQFVQNRPALPDGRFGAEGIHPNHVAVMLATGIPVAWQMATSQATNQNLFFRSLNTLYPLAALFGVMLTGSRGGAIACVPGILVIVIALLRRPVSAIPFTVGLLIAIPYALQLPPVQKNIERISTALSSASEDGFTGRGELWRAAVDIFQANPIIGVGSGGYRTAARASGNYAIHSGTGEALGAHSSYLQIASELGVLGISLFVSVLIALFFNFLRVRTGYRLAFMTGLLALANAMVSEMIEARYFTWIFLSIGLAISKWSQTSREPQTKADSYTESVPSTIRSSENLEPASTAR